TFRSRFPWPTTRSVGGRTHSSVTPTRTALRECTSTPAERWSRAVGSIRVTAASTWDSRRTPEQRPDGSPVTRPAYGCGAARSRSSFFVMGRIRGVVDRDVIDVIVDFRRALNEARPDQCPDVAAEYLCELFEGTATAL